MEMQERTRRAREQLILAGMELYARFGVEGVSLRAVNQHAGSANNSAAHYHFGNKENLITAILEYMFDLDEAEVADYARTLLWKDDPLTEAIINLVAPMVFISENREWGKFGVKFLSVLLISSDADKLNLWNQNMLKGANRFIETLLDLYPGTDDTDLRMRASFLYINFAIGLASDEITENTVFGDLSHMPELAQFACLVDYCRAGLQSGLKS